MASDLESATPVALLVTARQTIFSFSKCFEKMVLPQKLHWNMIFLVLSEKMKFFFTEIFFGRKMKDYVSPRNTCKYDIFCICGISFSYKYNTTLLSKRKDDLFPKMHLKITFQYHWKRWLYFFFVPVEVVYSFNFLIDVFWNSICLTFITQFGWKDLAYDYLFNFQRVSLCSRYGFFIIPSLILFQFE